MLLFIVSVIQTAFITPRLAKGELIDMPAFTSPIVVIFPGTATGIPMESPPKIETNPKGPAETPVPASTRVFEVIRSAISAPPIIISDVV